MCCNILDQPTWGDLVKGLHEAHADNGHCPTLVNPLVHFIKKTSIFTQGSMWSCLECTGIPQCYPAESWFIIGLLITSAQMDIYPSLFSMDCTLLCTYLARVPTLHLDFLSNESPHGLLERGCLQAGGWQSCLRYNPKCTKYVVMYYINVLNMAKNVHIPWKFWIMTIIQLTE